MMKPFEQMNQTKTGFKFELNDHQIYIHVVGLHGPPGSGKDTLCSIFDHWMHSIDNNSCIAQVNCPTMYFRKLAFADALKKGCSEFFGIPLRKYYDENDKEQIHPFWGTSPRQQAQLVGTEAMRESYDQNIWVKRVEWDIIQELTSSIAGSVVYKIQKKATREFDPTEFHVFFFISDVRFQNEADWIHSMNGVNLHIQTTRKPRTEHMSHASEVGVEFEPDKDYIIQNNDSLYEFKKNCINFFQEFFQQGFDLDPGNTGILVKETS